MPVPRHKAHPSQAQRADVSIARGLGGPVEVRDLHPRARFNNSAPPGMLGLGGGVPALPTQAPWTHPPTPPEVIGSNFSLVLSVLVSLGQKLSSAPLAPLKTQHHQGGLRNPASTPPSAFVKDSATAASRFWRMLSSEEATARAVPHAEHNLLRTLCICEAGICTPSLVNGAMTHSGFKLYSRVHSRAPGM